MGTPRRLSGKQLSPAVPLPFSPRGGCALEGHKEPNWKARGSADLRVSVPGGSLASGLNISGCSQRSIGIRLVETPAKSPAGAEMHWRSRRRTHPALRRAVPTEGFAPTLTYPRARLLSSGVSTFLNKSL